MGKKEGLEKKEILRSPEEIRQVKFTGKKVEDKYFIIHRASAPERKIGFAVAGEVRKATERNLLKRRMREVYRRNKDLFGERCIYLIRAKGEAKALPFEQLKESLLALVAKINLHKKGGSETPSTVLWKRPPHGVRDERKS